MPYDDRPLSHGPGVCSMTHPLKTSRPRFLTEAEKQGRPFGPPPPPPWLALVRPSPETEDLPAMRRVMWCGKLARKTRKPRIVTNKSTLINLSA